VRGFRRTAFIPEKSAVLAPMPNAKGGNHTKGETGVLIEHLERMLTSEAPVPSPPPMSVTTGCEEAPEQRKRYSPLFPSATNCGNEIICTD